MARIPYPDVDQLPAVARTALDKMAAPLNLMRMCAHSPMLVKPLMSLGTTILTRLALSPRRRELLVLRAARNARCEYVLAQHRTIALGVGLEQDEVDAICAAGFARKSFDPEDRVLLDAADELHQTETLRPGLVEQLAELLGHEQVVEVTVIVGYYRMIGGLLNGLAVDIDPHGEKFIPLAGPQHATTDRRI